MFRCIWGSRKSTASFSVLRSSFLGLKRFFCHLYEFLNPVQNAPAFVPAGLPPRYAITSVSVSVSVPVIHTSGSVPSAPPVSSSVPSTEFSVISSANYAVQSFIVSPVNSLTCIETNS